MANNGYPFLTQNQIVARLSESVDFRIESLQVLVARQTSDEQEEKVTKYTNKRGLRCSESVWMVQLAAKFRNEPEAVTTEEHERLASILPVYRKQLAAHHRQLALAGNPELANQAAKFGL